MYEVVKELLPSPSTVITRRVILPVLRVKQMNNMSLFQALTVMILHFDGGLISCSTTDFLCALG